ncbi:MAG: hypothetical protein JSR98_15580 [Proteobacteria bacterium]|nr:hypothetical protein [Pseudomonadota bacterium]
MLFSALIVAAAILADTTPAAATAATTATPPAATADAPAAKVEKTAKPKMICHSEAVIGSLFPKKTCYTEDQAKQRQQDERQNLEAIQNKH